MRMMLLATHDRVYAHGDGVGGHLVYAVEEALVRLAGALGELHDVRERGEGRQRLVEADVPVVAYAQQLQVYAARGGYLGVVRSASASSFTKPEGTWVFSRLMSMCSKRLWSMK